MFCLYSLYLKLIYSLGSKRKSAPKNASEQATSDNSLLFTFKDKNTSGHRPSPSLNKQLLQKKIYYCI